MNFWDILILLVVAGAVILGFFRARKRKAAGKGCCGSCEGCSLCCGKREPPESADL